MLTNNYDLDLMLPSQPNKDVVFNEAVIKIDSFCNMAIESFQSEVPGPLNLGAMHIIAEGQYAMSICYCASMAAGWRIQAPKKGMVFLVRSENKFFHFDGTRWEVVGS